MDIHKGFGNANIILGRLLYKGLENQNIQLLSIDGGGLRNAIPREGVAIVSVRNAQEFIEEATALKKDILEEFASVEPGLQINIENSTSSDQAISEEDSKK